MKTNTLRQQWLECNRKRKANNLEPITFGEWKEWVYG